MWKGNKMKIKMYKNVRHCDEPVRVVGLREEAISYLTKVFQL